MGQPKFQIMIHQPEFRISPMGFSRPKPTSRFGSLDVSAADMIPNFMHDFLQGKSFKIHHIFAYIFAAWFDQFDPSTKKGPMTHDPHLELPEELHVEATPAGFWRFGLGHQKGRFKA